MLVYFNYCEPFNQSNLKVESSRQCLTGKVDNNTGRIPPLAALSRFILHVWRLAGIRVACGSSRALEQIFFITPCLLSRLIIKS